MNNKWTIASIALTGLVALGNLFLGYVNGKKMETYNQEQIRRMFEEMKK